MVLSGVISPLVWVITIVTLLITLLITTHQPPSIPGPLLQGPQGIYKGFLRAP